MSLPRFFERVHAAAGRCLSISRSALEEILNGRIVALRCGRECNQNGNARWIADLLINMLARLYPQILISASEQSTQERLVRIAQEINPLISILTSGSEDVSVVIGDIPDRPSSAIYPSASGWVARLLNQPSEDLPGPNNPYSAGAAAAFAASEVFRRIFYDFLPEKSRRPQQDLHLSLLDFGTSSGQDSVLSSNSIAEVAFIGLGAVGNSAIWALARHQELEGKVYLIDHERVEVSNLQRYVLTIDTDEGAAKVDVAARELSISGLKFEKIQSKIEEFADSLGGNFGIPTACVTVDNVEGRRNVQALLSRLVINGWTGDAVLGMSWHEFNRNSACLSCLYFPGGPGKSQTDLVAEAFGLDPFRTAELWMSSQAPSDDEFRTIAAHLEVGEEDLSDWKGKPLNILYQDIICSASALNLKGKKQPAMVPLAHQSVMAGILVAAELVKRTDSRLASQCQEQVLVMWEDVLSPISTAWARTRNRVSGCICGDKIYQERYAEKWIK